MKSRHVDFFIVYLIQAPRLLLLNRNVFYVRSEELVNTFRFSLGLHGYQGLLSTSFSAPSGLRTGRLQQAGLNRGVWGAEQIDSSILFLCMFLYSLGEKEGVFPHKAFSLHTHTDVVSNSIGNDSDTKHAFHGVTETGKSDKEAPYISEGEPWLRSSPVDKWDFRSVQNSKRFQALTTFKYNSQARRLWLITVEKSTAVLLHFLGTSASFPGHYGNHSN